MLISPKRCSTRKISRDSDRFAGRGWIRKWTDRDASSCAGALLRPAVAMVRAAADILREGDDLMIEGEVIAV